MYIYLKLHAVKLKGTAKIRGLEKFQHVNEECDTEYITIFRKKIHSLIIRYFTRQLLKARYIL